MFFGQWGRLGHSKISILDQGLSYQGLMQLLSEYRLTVLKDCFKLNLPPIFLRYDYSLIVSSFTMVFYLVQTEKSRQSAKKLHLLQY